MNLNVPMGLLVCALVVGMPFAAGLYDHKEPKSVVAACGSGSADVSWEIPEDGYPVGYNVYKKAEGETLYQKANTVLVTSTWFSVQQLSSGVTYEFRVTAVYEDGNSSEMSSPTFCMTS